MGYVWEVFGFVPPGGISVIAEWQGSGQSRAPDEALAKFHSRLHTLTQLNRERWKHEHAHVLHGNGDGLFELLFESRRIAYRPLCTIIQRASFAVLLFATERNNRLRPPGAIETAQQRRRALLEHGASLELYDDYKPEIF
jgi:hypothetical protein